MRMIERVARAIAKDDNKSRPWEELSPFSQKTYLSLARSAIEAMRGPTDAMLSDRVIRHHGYAGDIDMVWDAMIDIALSEADA